MNKSTFPILNPAPGRAKTVPWAWIEQYRERAYRNHYQTLERLDERGGLAPGEIWMLITDSRRPPKAEAVQRAQDIIDAKIVAWRGTP